MGKVKKTSQIELQSVVFLPDNKTMVRDRQMGQYIEDMTQLPRRKIKR